MTTLAASKPQSTTSTFRHKANGYILHLGFNFAVVATGFKTPSANVKTGAMIQVWIIHSGMHPVEAVKTGCDAVVCGNCPHRGQACYVDVGKAPAAVFKAMRAGKYPLIPRHMIEDAFSGRIVRFGAYGDPALIPLALLAKIAAAASGFTGYTHQWARLPAGYERFLMASVDSEQELHVAQSRGWRTFRPRGQGQHLLRGEIECPNYTHGTTCHDCRLCAGTSRGKVKSISIPAHGSGAKLFNK